MKETPSSNREEPLLKSCPTFSMRKKASRKFRWKSFLLLC